MANTSTARKPLDQHIQELAAFEPSAFPVISLYLDLSPNQHGRDQHASFVRKGLAERLRALRPNTPEHASFERDAERIEAYLRDELDRSANGLALFACSGLNFFDAVQIGAPLDRHSLFVGPVPHLYPLVRLVDQYPRYAAVMLDTNHARIFVFGLNTVEREADVAGQKTRRVSVGGWSQARYQRHVENFQQQNVKEVVETLDRIVADEGIGHIVVVGHEVAVPLLRQELPQRLSGKLVDVIKLEQHASADAVLQATLEALRTKDAETDAERVTQMLDAWRAGGLAVAGPAATLEALQLGQVDELLITSTPQTLKPHTPAKVEIASGPLSVETSAPNEADPTRLVLADELVTRAQQTAARVRFIEDPALLEAVGGVGALLRFRL
jgi:peptide subunit release factor 1 (eRF1)